MKNKILPRRRVHADRALPPELVAVLLAFVGDPRTAHEALEAIDSWAELPSPPLGSFYRHLKRAVDVGWLRILDPTTSDRKPGRPSRHYSLTAEGTQTLRAALEHARSLVRLANARHLLVPEALS